MDIGFVANPLLVRIGPVQYVQGASLGLIVVFTFAILFDTTGRTYPDQCVMESF